MFIRKTFTNKNLLLPIAGIHHYLWNTGDTTATIKVLHSGVYSLTIKTEPAGCSRTAYASITKDCYIDIPNAFTPNGDGVKEYFFPRPFLTKAVNGFSMRIFNRWGQMLFFETSDRDEKGWDGRYGNKEVPGGVYLYYLDVFRGNKHIDHYEENVTIVR